MSEQIEESNRPHRLPRRMVIAWNVLAYVICFTIGLGFMPVYSFVSGIFGGRTVRVADAPNGLHTAKLRKKVNLADINFILTVDGQEVYRSNDLATLTNGSYREMLMWDETGRLVVVELMGKRVFAYDIIERRPLRKGELGQYNLFPSPAGKYYAEISDIDG